MTIIYRFSNALTWVVQRRAFFRSFSIIAIINLFAASPAQAIVLYDEAVQGDINGNTVQIVEAGTYSVSANTTRGFQGGPTDFDTLNILLSTGLEFTDGFADVSSVINQTGGTAFPSISLSMTTPEGTTFPQRFQFREDQLTFSASDLPVSDGIFAINSVGGCGGNSRCSGSYSYDWTYTLTASAVSQVPIGAPLWMLLAACGGLVGLRRLSLVQSH